MTGGNPTAHQAMPPFSVSSGPGGEMLWRPVLDRHDAASLASLEMPVRLRDQAGGPFAAELDVINRQNRSPGPIRRSVIPEPDVRRRDGRTQRSFPYYDERRPNNSSHHSQPILQETHRPKIPIFDGSDDWDSFLVPFQCQARKNGWTAAERVDKLCCGIIN